MVNGLDKSGRVGHGMMAFVLLSVAIIVLGALPYGLASFFGKGQDYRNTEARILNDKIEECLSKGFVESTLGDEFYSLCEINRAVVSRDFLVIVKSGEEIIFKAGRGEETHCNLADKNPNFPSCEGSLFFANGKEYALITGSTQKTRRNA